MLAIIIPYFKLTFFEATLRSLEVQTDKRFKVYIVNDASPEDPTGLLEKYKGKFDFVYHRFEDNLGGISLVQQWERCIAITGDEEWIMILGDDDVLGETVVASWYENYEIFNEKSNVVRFASKVITEETGAVSHTYMHPVWEAATDSFYRKLEYLTRSSLSEYVFSKASYLKYGFYNYPSGWYSDDKAWIDFAGNKPIFSINESVVSIRNSFLNISSRKDNLEVKNKAEMVFYRFMILNKLNFYKKEQRLKLIRKYEDSIKKSKNLTIREWLLLTYFYLKFFDLYSFKKFIKRLVKNLLRYE
ncbi:glycosyltransferase family 2 protein [Flavobacterium ranwuense]|uniref:Glycosyltransferase family 2 protein n=1 Tax=Flavobacterium ranwuense TaxID=2541725 RepID=A0ABY2DPD6_9FLAO|nr:glycosyltransferase family 2 protein [Flavobacterium ranwuense]TDE28051.1 glycosyltransferase family 2 protein [Flavobacterium ranwuense]